MGVDPVGESVNEAVKDTLPDKIKVMKPQNPPKAPDATIPVSRSGYTGEDGVEILIPKDSGIELWDVLLENGVAPCGLGWRDTLRLEAGMHLSLIHI